MRISFSIGALSFVLLAGCAGGTTDGGVQTLQERQDMIHDRGSDVMPFALEATQHVFKKTDKGGVQEVSAADPEDAETIALIHGHLADIAVAFEQGDFRLPTQLHGDDMPGVQYLSEHTDRFSTEYVALANGAQIVYTADDGETVDALHAWFDAQLMDHGTDANAIFDPADDPCLDANIPEGHPPELWKVHHGCS